MQGKGIRFKDIAVVTRNLAEYEGLHISHLPQYSIPFFIDRKSPLTATLVTLRSIHDGYIVYNWTYESVFRYLKQADRDSQGGN